MPKTIDQAAKEVAEAIGVMPDGYSVSVDRDKDGIIVGTPEMAFALTRQTIEDGLHVSRAVAMFPVLVETINRTTPKMEISS